MTRIHLIWFLTLIIFVKTTTASTEAVKTKVVILGDSLTDGYGVSREQAYPAILEALVNRSKMKSGKKIEVINAGLSGDTTAGGLRRLNWYLKMQFEILIIALGSNDGLRGLVLEKSKENLNQIINKAKERKIKVILAGMKIPPNYGKDYTEKFENIFVDLANKHEIPLIPFLLKGVGGQTHLNQADAIHPNEAGHKIIAKTVFSILEPLL